VTTSLFSARELVGLLADDDRRAVFAALVLGAADADSVRRRSGLEARPAMRALQRLVDAGLVIRGDDGTVHLLGESFALAARVAAEHAPRPDEHGDEPDDVARVLRAFVRDGRLVSIPTVHSKRLVVLDWLSQRFEPGRRYSEQMVNLILGQVHADTAALRRYLVDDDFLSRADGYYWRTGGSYAPDDAARPDADA
jgi:DNA-binding transcriptional ArsR family regulator